jgi:hypothetical protein
METQVLISLAGILGSGFSAYLGVRIALTELRGDLKRLEGDLDALEHRTARLEAPYFKRHE